MIQGLMKLKEARLKIGLTGTLLTNSPLNAFTPLKWINVEKSTLTNFKGLYCEYGGFGGHQIVGYKNIDILKNEIDSCSLRRTKDMLKDLPPKTVIIEKLDMNDHSISCVAKKWDYSPVSIINVQSNIESFNNAMA